jgi:hypothetical protein
VAALPAHRSKAGVGAVGGVTQLAHAHRIVSYGADGALAFMDTRRCSDTRVSDTDCSGTVARVQVGDHIYSMALVAGGAAIATGTGRGALLLHDSTTHRLMYGMGCNRGAVRCILAAGDNLLAAGDDGNAIAYNFAHKPSTSADDVAHDRRRESCGRRAKPRPEWQT